MKKKKKKQKENKKEKKLVYPHGIARARARRYDMRAV